MEAPLYRYCPCCGELLRREVRHGALRPTCATCGFVHFSDPKVAVVGLVTQGATVLLVRRGVSPGKGMWALPGGFMDAGEMPEAALVRELLEETGVAVEAGPLIAIQPLVVGDETRGIVLVFAALVIGTGELVARGGDDVSDAGWFRHDALPKALAFDSSRALLAQWVARFA